MKRFNKARQRADHAPRGPENGDEPGPASSLLARALAIVAVLLAVGLAGALTAAFAVVMMYPNLPPIDFLANYRPDIPLRVFTADEVLIGEFGEEHREVVHIKDVPDIMKKAVLAIEDARFYEHGPIDYVGILRAAMHDLSGGPKQGASTITQQVARALFLSREQTLKRKIYEALMSWKIEQNLSKDQILELYMNQIYLGEHAYGFAEAAQIYFGKKLADVSIAEAAMLAGLPKAPSAYNPVANPERAKARQQYILTRMRDLGYITQADYAKASAEHLKVKTVHAEFGVHAEYVAELARQFAYAEFKDEIYTRGLNVYTTITKADQDAAYLSVRRAVMAYDKRGGYRGPEGHIDFPSDKKHARKVIEAALADHPDSDDLLAAVVLDATPGKVQAVLSSGEKITITGQGLDFAAKLLTDKGAPGRRVRRGAIIRVIESAGLWSITEMPEVEAAFVATNTGDGSIRALVGGFDFDRNSFNHVTQAWRQPGSAFKPFIYSAALEKGLSPATLVNDAPITFTAQQTGGKPWTPKNYEHDFEGPMTMRQGLAKSRNLVSIRILQNIGVKYGQDYITRFGFDGDRNPPYLTLVLGVGAVTPLQMAGAYSVFANGGYKVNPYLVSKITDSNGNVLSSTIPARAGDESNRVIDERNAFLMDSMLKDVIRHGTGTGALSLKRTDLAGKTGTTNGPTDVWFAGYQPKITDIAWMGYDRPRNLDRHATGGIVALPIWTGYMRAALKGVPVEERPIPEGIVKAGDDYYYAENPPGTGVERVGIDIQTGDAAPKDQASNAVKDELF